MRRIISFLLFFCCMTGALYAQRMSDEQVIQYVKNGQAQGKSQKQMTTELMSRGVTKDQVERIRAKYEGQEGNEDRANTVGGQTRERRADSSKEMDATDFDEIAADIQDPTTRGGAKKVFGRNVFSSRNLTFEPNTNVATPDNYKLGPGDEVIIDVWGASENTIRQTISIILNSDFACG